MNGSQLIVRVKRRRDQLPADSLCIVEDEAPRSKKAANDTLLNGMGNLSTADAPAKLIDTSGGRSIVLKRVRTLDSISGNQLEYVVSSTQVSNQQEEPQHLQNGNGIGGGGESLWITKSKKAFRSDENGSDYVVVDMSQVPYNEKMDISINSNNSDNRTIPRSPISNPPTRRLDSAIEVAWTKNDFNDLAFAILQGADINYQRPLPASAPACGDVTDQLQGGETALMAAARRGNLRMVTRLLSLDANVFLTDSRGMTAMDHLKHQQTLDAQSHWNKNSQEISLRLHSAALRHYRGRSSGSHQPEVVKADEETDYVVDVFYSSNPAPPDQTTPSNQLGTSCNTHPFFAPVVKVDGLKIGSDGAVDILFAYDSDWSDLGDDEDPDSNDERYHGNDYPDEQDDEEDFVDEDEGVESETERHLGIGRADIESDEDALRPSRGYHKYHQDDDADDEDDEDDEDDKLERYGRNTICRVVKHTIQGGDAFAPAGHTRESIRRLWGETGGVDDDEDNDDERTYEGISLPGYGIRDRFKAGGFGMGRMPVDWSESSSARDHRDRLQAMRQASGMEFGAIPREFDVAGLPKYGTELSDEGEDDMMAGFDDNARPPKNTAAYDPDFDDEL